MTTNKFLSFHIISNRIMSDTQVPLCTIGVDYICMRQIELSRKISVGCPSSREKERFPYETGLHVL